LQDGGELRLFAVRRGARQSVRHDRSHQRWVRVFAIRHGNQRALTLQQQVLIKGRIA
jgi:hypothetical protein